MYHNKETRHNTFFSKYGHKFLMRYPENFGQRRKKLGLTMINNMFKAKINWTSSFPDIWVLRIYHIWAYHKKLRITDLTTVLKSQTTIIAAMVLLLALKCLALCHSHMRDGSGVYKQYHKYIILWQYLIML